MLDASGMIRRYPILNLLLRSAILSAFAPGCASTPPPPAQLCLILVPGVQGDAGYDGLRRGLQQASLSVQLQSYSWGAPPPIWFLNFQTRSIHEAAEAGLRRRLQQIASAPAALPIDLIGHSAGCGVILGALAQLPRGIEVQNVILLAPSVSPGYDLQPALAHIRGKLHVFYSDRDRLFLSWRTGTFGTYDNIKTSAAGNCGFRLSGQENSKIVQHAYDLAWRALDNDGDHFGTLSEKFDRAVIVPLLTANQREPSAPATTTCPSNAN
jgi:pimeloyl-ACP methyl ester carboxylesterase